MPERDEWGWWAIHGESLMDALKRCADGDDPGVVYTELFANSRQEAVEADDPDEASALIAQARALFTAPSGYVAAREVARRLADYVERTRPAERES